MAYDLRATSSDGCMGGGYSGHGGVSISGSQDARAMVSGFPSVSPLIIAVRGLQVS